MPAPSVAAVLVRCSWNVTIIGARKIQCHYLSYRGVGRHTWNATSVLELATNIGALWIECHQYWCAVDWMPPILVQCCLNIGALWIECHQYWCAVDGMPPILVRYCLDIGALWIECHQYWCAIVWILVRWRWNATNIGAILFEYWCAEDGMPLLCLCSVARMWPMLVRCRWNHSIGMPPICTRKTTFFGEGALLHLLSALLCWDFSLNWRCTRELEDPEAESTKTLSKIQKSPDES